VIASERQVADVLDALHVEWEYEPVLFAFEKGPEGNILEGFRPDFFLPKFNLYIEVTMAKQRNVTTKNRKARLLRELYPGTQIEIIYRADFQDLEGKIRQLLRAYRPMPTARPISPE